MTRQLLSPYPFFTDGAGKPLNGGYVYLGETNKDPELFPIAAYWDSALTQPAPQPLRTEGGYIVDLSGEITAVYVAETSFSLRWSDRLSVPVDYVPNSTTVELAGYVTLGTPQTVSSKTFSGGIGFHTNGSRIGITNASTTLTGLRALTHIANDGSDTNGLLITNTWTGSTATPYNNNDGLLIENYNRALSNSANRSWGVSSANAYNDIPLGVTDSGDRYGLFGWAVSAFNPSYMHRGTLALQVGVYGLAGFLEPGNPSTGVVQLAIGVRGYAVNQSTGTTINSARAGEFVSDAHVGIVQENIAVYASAASGTVTNYSFYGANGRLYNQGQIAANSLFTESSSGFCSRDPGNAFEFGFPTAGNGSNLGATFASGFPFFALCAEGESTGNTFRTRGNKGAMVWSDLTGALIFSRLTAANAAGQSPTENARFDANGYFVFPSLGNYANDAAAAAGGVPVGGFYRNGSVVMFRVV